MLHSLKQRGWETTFLGWERNGLSIDCAEYANAIDSLLCVKVPAPTESWKLVLKLPAYYSQLAKMLSKLGRQDCVILTHIFLLPLAHFLKCRIIYDSAEIYSLDMASYFRGLKKLALPFWRKVESALVKKVDGITVVDSEHGWLQRYFMKAHKRVEVIYNFPAIFQDPDSGQTHALEGLYRDRQVIAFVGGLMKDKGFRVALEAAALVKASYPDCLFLFMGPMKDDPEVVTGMVKDLAIEKNVVFRDSVGYREMLAHIRHARAGLMLLQPLGLYLRLGPLNGRKCVSYMQAGIPVIGPSFGEVGAVVQKEQCGVLVDTSSPVQVAEAILEFLGAPREANLMGRRGREAFLREYNWEREARKFTGLIEAVLHPGYAVDTPTARIEPDCASDSTRPLASQAGGGRSSLGI